jgi:hypothetical protein
MGAFMLNGKIDKQGLYLAMSEIDLCAAGLGRPKRPK